MGPDGRSRDPDERCVAVPNTVSRGILISGSPGENNVVKGNQAVDPTPLKIQNEAGAKVEDNHGFEMAETAWMSHHERKARQREQQKKK